MNGLGLFGGTTIQYLNPSYVMDHGARTLSWSGQWRELKGCDIQAPATEIDTDNRQGTLAQYTLYMPDGSPVADNARVRYGSQELQVDGMVLRIGDPLGILPYAKASLKVWGG